MPRVPGVHWDKSKGAWRTDAGREDDVLPGHRQDRQGGGPGGVRETYVQAMLAADRSNPDRSDGRAGRQCCTSATRPNATAKARTFEGHQEMLLACSRTSRARRGSPSRYGLRRARSDPGRRTWPRWNGTWAAAATCRPTIGPGWCGRSRHAGHGRRGGTGRLLPANPLKDAAGVAVPYSRKRRVDDEQARAFLAFIRRRAERMTPLMARFTLATADLIEFVRETGCRPGEACSARWDQYHPDRALILQAEHKTSGKTGRPRKIVLTARAAEIVERIRALPDHHPEFIFTHKRGKGAIGRGRRPRTASRGRRGCSPRRSGS
jgi:integrase